MKYEEIIAEIEELQEEECRYRRKLDYFEKNKDKITEKYFKAKCGNKYNEIYELLSEIKSYIYEEGETSLTKQRKRMSSMVIKSIHKLISRKTLIVEDGNRGIYAGPYGIGEQIKYYDRANPVTNMHQLIQIFKMYPTADFGKKIKNYTKKTLIREYQKTLVNYKFLDDISKKINVNNANIHLRDPDSSLSMKSNIVSEISISVGRWSNYITLGSNNYSYYSDKNNKIFFNTETITPYECYLASQVWEYLKPKLIEILDILKQIYDNNEKLKETILDKLGYILVAQQL